MLLLGREMLLLVHAGSRFRWSVIWHRVEWRTLSHLHLGWGGARPLENR